MFITSIIYGYRIIIAFNNLNNQADANNNHIMQIFKSDNRIMKIQIQILLITASISSPLITIHLQLIKSMYRALFSMKPLEIKTYQCKI